MSLYISSDSKKYFFLMKKKWKINFFKFFEWITYSISFLLDKPEGKIIFFIYKQL